MSTLRDSKKEYSEDDYLMLSGIQHFYYSKRQWSLIHVEQAWAENRFTIEGKLLHEKSDNPYIKEKRKDTFYSRAIPVSSSYLGLSGILDTVEFKRDEKRGYNIPGHKGKWLPKIIEFKRGKPKRDKRDIVQVVAEAMCLEEMLDITINEAYLFYNAVKERYKVEITLDLRKLVKSLADQMHEYFDRGITAEQEDFYDKNNSLNDLGMEGLLKNYSSAKEYFKKNMDL